MGHRSSPSPFSATSSSLSGCLAGHVINQTIVLVAIPNLCRSTKQQTHNARGVAATERGPLEIIRQPFSALLDPSFLLRGFSPPGRSIVAAARRGAHLPDPCLGIGQLVEGETEAWPRRPNLFFFFRSFLFFFPLKRQLPAPALHDKKARRPLSARNFMGRCLCRAFPFFFVQPGNHQQPPSGCYREGETP